MTRAALRADAGLHRRPPGGPGRDPGETYGQARALELAGRGLLGPKAVPALQRTVGNRAVTGLLSVQRHSSFEHSIMSNATPKQVEATSEQGDIENRKHLLTAERDRAVHLGQDPYSTPPSDYPFEGVQVIRLKGSGVWVTQGEITALADYLPDGEEINAVDADRLLRILQYVRHEIFVNCSQILAGPDFRKAETDSADTVTAEGWPGAQERGGLHPIMHFSDPLKKVLTEDQATEEEGAQSYSGLLTRNACHFAPFSWERYTLHHNLAVELGRQAWTSAHLAFSQTVPYLQELFAEQHHDLRTQANVDGAYADHFLQDSFAAGHLINKTLVEQWFLEWADKEGHLGVSTWGVPDNDLGMTVADQPNIAGEALYGQMGSTGSVLGADGKPVAYDPQTVSEMDGSWEDHAKAVGTGTGGDKPTAHNYWEMLRWASLNYVAGDIHDMFNEQGLMVKNNRGDVMFVGGDSEQFQIAGTSGMAVPIEASTMSRKAVTDAIITGQPSATAEDCLALVPTIVKMLFVLDIPLEQWNEKVLRDLCFNGLFQKIWDEKTFSRLRKLIDNHADRVSSPDWRATSMFPGAR